MLTRKRKREVELTDEEACAMDPNVLQYPPAPRPQRSADEAEEGTVEEMLCEQDVPSTVAAPKSDATSSTSTRRMSVDEDGAPSLPANSPPPPHSDVLGGLQYPDEPVPMDVDEEGSSSKLTDVMFSGMATEVDANTATTVSSPAASDIAAAAMSVDGDEEPLAPEPVTSTEEPSKTVPTSVFYGKSAKAKGKGKEKKEEKPPSPEHLEEEPETASEGGLDLPNFVAEGDAANALNERYAIIMLPVPGSLTSHQDSHIYVRLTRHTPSLSHQGLTGLSPERSGGQERA